MGPITRILPRPRLLTIGGSPFLVWEFRLREYAELQGWLDDQWGDPLVAVREIPAEADWEQRRPAVIAAYERAEAGAPTIWDLAGRLQLASPEGLTYFLWVALRRGKPGITVEETAGLFARITPGEFSRLRDTVYGDDPADVAERMIFGPVPPTRGRKLLWPEVICSTAKECGYTLAELYDLTMNEFCYLRNGGIDPPRGRELAPGEDAEEVSRKQRERYYGVTEPAEDTSAGQTRPDPPIPLPGSTHEGDDSLSSGLVELPQVQ